MGFFKKKQQQKEPVKAAKPVSTRGVFSNAYKEELRKIGRAEFKKLINDSASQINTEASLMMSQVAGQLKEHLARQLDLTVVRLNAELTKHLNERMTDFNRIASESQELVIQSLSRNAQAVHEKYQQMSSNLTQIIASQEVMMATVFQDNQSKVASIQSEQEAALGKLKASVEGISKQSDEIKGQLLRDSEEQAKALKEMYAQANQAAASIGQSQTQATESLQKSVSTLEEQHARLQQLLDEAVAKQKQMATDTINEHMARIIEHYIVGALGERSDIAKDLPNILEKMNEQKQAMSEDMQL